MKAAGIWWGITMVMVMGLIVAAFVMLNLMPLISFKTNHYFYEESSIYRNIFYISLLLFVGAPSIFSAIMTMKEQGNSGLAMIFIISWIGFFYIIKTVCTAPFFNGFAYFYTKNHGENLRLYVVFMKRIYIT